MSRPAAILAVLVVSLTVLAGCGGPEVAYTEVKSPPQALPIPADTGTGSADPTADDKATRDANGVKKSKADGSDTSSASGTSASGTSSSGASTPSTTSQSAATAAPTAAATTAPSTGTGANTGGSTPATPSTGTSSGGSSTGGASPGGNDQFCADNPGACNGGN